MAEDCIFCKIAKGEVPSHKVYEDEGFVAFLDINPINPGHALVIPKEHYRWVWDVPDIGRYFEAVAKVANAQRKAFGTEWVVSVVIGEAVPHAHVWLVPRMKGDGHGGTINFKLARKYTKEQMKDFAERIRAAVV